VGICILVVASKFAGIVAILLQVPSAVNAGVILLLQNTFIPSFPPATKA